MDKYDVKIQLNFSYKYKWYAYLDDYTLQYSVNQIISKTMDFLFDFLE